MVTSFTDYLAQAKAQVNEISPSDLVHRMDTESNLVVIDVREQSEFEQGVVPNAKLISRGLLELKIEGVVPDHDTPIALYCAGGVRSVLAAKSLQSMGYSEVVSVDGGFTKYAQSGFKVETRRTLSTTQSARYSRHLRLPEVGETGQIKLLDARVLCIGAGGLGSSAALYMAAAGVGTLGIVDADTVDMSNLQRQILHTEDRIGVPKVDSAEIALKSINSSIHVKKHHTRLTSQNVSEIFEQYDIIVDGSDNFPTRYLINDACVMMKKPNVHGSIFRFDGQTTVFHPEKGPCYRCLYPEPPPAGMAPSCQEAGVLGVLPGVIGVMQAIETIKLILSSGTPLIGRLITFDALRMEFRELKMNKDPNCPVCSDNATIKELVDYEAFCSGDGASQG